MAGKIRKAKLCKDGVIRHYYYLPDEQQETFRKSVVKKRNLRAKQVDALRQTELSFELPVDYSRNESGGTQTSALRSFRIQQNNNVFVLIPKPFSGQVAQSLQNDFEALPTGTVKFDEALNAWVVKPNWLLKQIQEKYNIQES